MTGGDSEKRVAFGRGNIDSITRTALLDFGGVAQFDAPMAGADVETGVRAGGHGNGGGAVAAVDQYFDARRAEYETWRDVSVSTDFD